MHNVQDDIKSASKLRGKDKKRYQALLELRNNMADQVSSLSSASLLSSREAGEELADIGTEDFIRETELSLLSTEGDRLAQITTAMERLLEGTYGICYECGEKIPEARLVAKPYANYCVDCKSKLELNR